MNAYAKIVKALASPEDVRQSLMEDYRRELCHLRSFASEVVLSDAQQLAACKARLDGDAMAFTKVWDDAIEAWADDEIEAIADSYGYELWEAARHLCEVHAERRQVAA